MAFRPAGGYNRPAMQRHETSERALLAICCLAASVAGCGNGGQAPEPRPPTGIPDGGPPERADRRGPSAGEAVPVARTVPGARAAEPDPALVPLFDFAANLERAFVRSRGLLVDFGTPARHKHTLGDWKTGWRGDYRDGETTFTYIDGAAARIYFDALPVEEGGGRIELRARAVGGGRGRVYLNGVHRGNVDLPREGFQHAAVSFEKGVVPGRNEILLRFDAKKPAHDGRAAAVAVDYVRVVAGPEAEGPAAAAGDAFRVSGPAKGGAGLVLAAGESLTFHLPIPPGALVAGRARAREGSSRATLVVTARCDGRADLELGRLELGSEEVPLSLPLAGLAGETAAITLAVIEGEARLSGTGMHAARPRGDAAPGRRAARNLVLVLIDTLRADHLSIYDRRTRVKTPFLDRLAAESMVFSRPLVQENWTKPSTATLLTGLYPETHGTKNEKHVLPRTATMISEHLRSLGFATAAFVANGYVSSKFGFQRGWDAWTNYVREGKPNRAQFVMDDAVAWLGRRPKDRPFFLYVHTIDPHVPYMPPAKYRALYDDQPYDGPVQATGTAKLLEQVKTGAIRLNDRDKVRLEALYDGEISYHDEHFGRLYDALAASGLLEDTLIVVTADHGEEFFEHGSVGHGHSMYEELLHVPLVFRLPGAEARERGAACPAEVGLVDVLPTACAMLGIECPGGVEGASLVPLLAGDAADGWPRAAFSDFLDGQRVARLGRWKLIVRGLSTTLFDLETDPRETEDLSAKRPIALAAMLGLLGMHQGRFVPTGEVGARPGADGKAPAPKVHKAEETEIDPETRKQLEALGYMGE
jgi:arylsulfatase A-like enzyme